MVIGIKDELQKCLECDRECKNRRSLGNHVAKSHRTLGNLKEYVLKHFLDGMTPKCKCGCNRDVNWHKCLYHFNDFVTGHNESNFRFYAEKVMTKERRISKIRETYSSISDIRSRISRSVTEAFKDLVKQQNLSDGQKRGWQNVERKENQREHAYRLLRLGLIGPQAPFKTEWVLNPFTGQQEYMHSSWESAFLNLCIQESFPVTKKHDIRIPYVDPNGISREYVPDFVGLESLIIFEIKGHRDETVDLKEAACLEWCVTNDYELVMIEEKV